MMRFRNCFVLGVFFAVAVGCGAPPAKPDPEPAASVSPTNSVVSTTPPPQGSTANPIEKPSAQSATKTDGKPAPADTDRITKVPTQTFESTWRPSEVSAAQLAGDADKVLKGLKDIKATMTYVLKNQVGQAQGTLSQEIKGPTVFSLEYPVLHKDKKYGVIPVVARSRANGKVISEKIDDVVSSRPVGSPKAAPADLAQNWPNLAGREIFAGLIDERKPLTEYVTALLEPKNSYTVQVMERKLSSNGRVVNQYLIKAIRSGPSAALLGKSAVQMIIDADFHLPVTIAASVRRPGASVEDSVQLNAKWERNTKFDNAHFTPLAAGKKA
jgi:hypothetical protein